MSTDIITSAREVDDDNRLADRSNRGLPVIYTHGQKGVEHLRDVTINNEVDFLHWIGRISDKVPDSTPAKHIEAMQWWHRMGIHDQEDVGAVVRSLPKGTRFVPKAEYPVEVLAGVLHFEPDLLKDPKAHDKLLRQFPEYCDPSYNPRTGQSRALKGARSRAKVG